MSARDPAARLLACPRMRAAVAADSARNRARLAGITPGRARPSYWSALALALILLALAGCSVTLYSRAWMSQAQCDALPETEARTVQDCARYEYVESYETHNASGGYADACGELPPLVGDDC